MSVRAVSAKDATIYVGTLPSVSPRPTATNLCQLVRVMSERAQPIPSQQSEDHGYQGLIEAPTVYALTGSPSWTMIMNPGPHRAVVANATGLEQRNSETIYNAAKGFYNSQQNVKKYL